MASKKMTRSTQSIIYILAVLGFIVVINYLSNKAFKRVDLTESKQYSISSASKEMLNDLDDIVNVKVYFSENLPPRLQNLESGVRDLLTEFKVYAERNLRIEWEDPSKDEDTKSKVRELGIPEVQLQTVEKDKAQVMNGFLGIAVLYADEKEVLPVIQDLTNFEYDLMSAIMKVLRTETPKVGVVKTDTMPSLPPNIQQQMQTPDGMEETYKPIFENLRKNYEVVTVDLSKGEPIDPSIRTLIVPGGDDKSFSERDLFEIDQYFMNGGNLIVLADAMKVDFQYGINATPSSPRILELVKHYGVSVEPKMVLDASCGRVNIPQKVGMFEMNVPVEYPYFIRLGAEGFNTDNPAVSGLSDVIMPWASPVKLLVGNADSTDSGTVNATVLAHSSEKSWTEAGRANLNPRQNWPQVLQNKQDQLEESNLMVHVTGSFNSYFAGKSVPSVKQPGAEGDSVMSQISLSAQDSDRDITGQNVKGHLVVAGDSDFLSSQNAAPSNITLLMNLVDWLTLDENLIEIRSRAIADRTLEHDQLKEGNSFANVIRYANVLGMPLLVIALGIVIFFKRRETVNTKPAGAKTEEKKQ
ncbi:MAG: GldG family protein [Chitinispirillaceae bacterium]